MKQILFLLTISLLLSCGSGSGTPPVITPDIPLAVAPPPPPPPPPPPVDPVEFLEVEIGKAGDRFYPVVVNITYTVDDVAQPYEYTVSLGVVEETDDGLLIYGDGTTGDGTLTVNDEEYRFTIVSEPTCDVTDAQYGLGTDCAGYLHRIPSQGPFIYYGEEDTTVVEWDLVYLHWDSTCAGYEEDPRGDLQNTVGPCDPDDWLPNEREQIVRVIDAMNAMYERAGVYVKLVPVRIQKGYFGGPSAWKPDVASDLNLWADGPMGSGSGGVICGYAGYSGAFRYPLSPYSACGVGVHLHEIGHTVGLSHGPDNPINASGGITFPNFGHGQYSVCPGHDSIMSYGTKTMVSSESRTCAEASPYGNGGDLLAGLRAPYGYDEAYAINRIRYNVALISTKSPLSTVTNQEQSIADVYPIEEANKMIQTYRRDFGIDLNNHIEKHKQIP